MCSDMELFKNLIYLTEFMQELLLEDMKTYLECIKLTQDWNKFKNVNEIIELNNKYINNAIKEILQNDRFIKIIKEDTEIDINKIKIN